MEKNLHLERLDGVAPFLRFPLYQLVALCEQKLARKLMIVRGWSSVKEQLALYSKGRIYDAGSAVWLVTDSLAVVTNALPGRSAHNVITVGGDPFSLAADVIPLFDDGSPEWDVDDNFWDNLYELAWKCGLDPLGDPLGAYLKSDKGHFEEPAWKLKLDGLKALQPSAIVGGGGA